MLKIHEVLSGGVADELGIKPGASLSAFDGAEAADIIDYQYYNSAEEFVMTVEDGGEVIDYEISKDADEDLGLVTDDGLRARACRNKCVFCFVDQLPKGMRKSLYFKDDDWRLSVISGNYVTLTNLTARDKERIIKYRVSPLYISVHASAPAVRAKLLGVKEADIMPYIKEFSGFGIKIHAQIVVVPHLNDGEVLAQTIKEIAPYIQSLAVVPVGLTDFKNPDMCEVSLESAREIITLCERHAEEFLDKRGTRLVFCADEMYLKAGLNIKYYGYYEGFSQIDNGVGLISEFRQNLVEELASRETATRPPNKAVIITGTAAYAFMTEIASLIGEKYPDYMPDVLAVPNKTFGTSVTVTGLVCGKDIFDAVKNTNGRFTDSRLIIPRVMLREGTETFLDGMTAEELSAKLGLEIIVTDTTAAGLLSAILGAEMENT